MATSKGQSKGTNSTPVWEGSWSVSPASGRTSAADDGLPRPATSSVRYKTCILFQRKGYDQVYDFFIVDKDGHNKGYISASGELHWWPVKQK
jgi:hypothetical protein